MEDQKAEDKHYFWAWRHKNNWPPIPQEMLKKAKQIAAEQAEAGFSFTVCGVPVAELTHEETRAALILTMNNIRKYTETGLFG